MQNMDYEPKIGDWVRPIDPPIIEGISYGFNLRLVISIDKDDKDSFTTTCNSFGIEKDLWNIYNTEFVARLVLE